jgi:nicotinamide-nucleotide amidase
MRAEIIAVGTELTNGSQLDTNSAWLSAELGACGLTVQMHTVVADDLPSIVELFRQAIARSDVVVATGGIGPTLDDLTRPALAEALGVPLVVHERSLAKIRERFASRDRDMPERNSQQAMLPSGGTPIDNERGTAPGIWVEHPGRDRTCRIAVLPGVPSEMRPMFADFVVPRLPDGRRVIRHYCVHCFGAGESAVEEMLGDLTARGRQPEVGITAQDATITLRIAVTAHSPEECDRQADDVRATIRQRLGELVFGEGDVELQHVVTERLRQRSETLAVIETGLTGGRLADWLSAVPGTEDVFRGGLTLVSPGPMLHRMLQRAEQIAGTTDLRTRARGEAEKARQYAEATWGLAVIGDNTAASGAAADGAIGLVGPDVVATQAYRSYGDPAIDRSRAAKSALDLLRRQFDQVR